MATRIWKNPIEVNNRLDQLGLKLPKLLEVVDAMVGAKAECTDNDPPGSRGWSSYRMGTRRLREVTLVEDGWEKDDTDQIASVVNKKLGIRIAVGNTDDGTGIEEDGRFPQNRSKKGAATDRAIQAGQGSFMDILDESLNVVPLNPSARPPRAIVTYYLCVYCEGDEFRAELSAPDGVDGGFFTGFVERIFLASPGSGDDGLRRRRPDDGEPDFDIPVTRKK
jgi:hypothetical protein